MSYILWIFTKLICLHVKHLIALTKRESVRRIFICNSRSYACQYMNHCPQKKNKKTRESVQGKKKKAHACIKRAKSDRSLTKFIT